MKKDELLTALWGLKGAVIPNDPEYTRATYGTYRSYIERTAVIDLVKQLEDKPAVGRISVPQWFSDWYVGLKLPSSSISRKVYAIALLSQVGYGKGLETSMQEDTSFELETFKTAYVVDNKEKLIRAVLDGYAVEKEQLYEVIFPTKEDPCQEYALFKNKLNGKVGIHPRNIASSRLTSLLTREEVESVDSRYMAFAREV